MIERWYNRPIKELITSGNIMNSDAKKAKLL